MFHKVILSFWKHLWRQVKANRGHLEQLILSSCYGNICNYVCSIVVFTLVFVCSYNDFNNLVTKWHGELILHPNLSGPTIWASKKNKYTCNGPPDIKQSFGNLSIPYSMQYHTGFPKITAIYHLNLCRWFIIEFH